jgi:hypothetical protein
VTLSIWPRGWLSRLCPTSPTRQRDLALTILLSPGPTSTMYRGLFLSPGTPNFSCNHKGSNLGVKTEFCCRVHCG